MIHTLIGALAFVTIMLLVVAGVATLVQRFSCKNGDHRWRPELQSIKKDAAVWRECRFCDHYEWFEEKE